MSKRIKLDPENMNRHTAAGMALLRKSVDEVGVIESIAIDADGVVITGNAHKEVSDERGMKPKVIQLADDEYPVIQTDLTGEKRVKVDALLHYNNMDEWETSKIAAQNKMGNAVPCIVSESLKKF